MAQRIVLQTEAGRKDYAVFVDNVTLALAYRNREVAMNEEIIYRGAVCEIIDEYKDEDGFVWTVLTLIAPLGNMGFSIMM